MTLTATIVSQNANRLQYLVTSDASGGTLTIPNVGGATPDLTTDSLAGPIKAIALAKTNGIGNIAAGTALTQGQARAILLSDNTSPVSTTGTTNGNVPHAYTSAKPRTGVTPDWSVDANVDGSGNPTLVISRATAAVGTCYLIIDAEGAIG